jgi:hypothetical protein
MQLANRKEKGRPGFISQDAEYGSEDLITTTKNEWCHGIMKLIGLVRETDIHDQSHRLLLGTLVKCNKSTYASLLYTCAKVHFLRDCKYLYCKRLIPPLLLGAANSVFTGVQRSFFFFFFFQFYGGQPPNPQSSLRSRETLY